LAGEILGGDLLHSRGGEEGDGDGGEQRGDEEDENEGAARGGGERRAEGGGRKYRRQPANGADGRESGRIRKKLIKGAVERTSCLG